MKQERMIGFLKAGLFVLLIVLFLQSGYSQNANPDDITHLTDFSKYYVTKIESEDLEQSDRFGYSVDIDGDYAVVGAYGEATNGSSSGAGYIFKQEEGTWVQKAKLTITGAEAYDLLAYAVAISGNTVILSARGKEAAYIYEKPAGGEWQDATETAKLTPYDIHYNNYFSDNVDIHGDYVIIGDWGQSDAYIYEKPAGGWVDMTQTLLLDPPGNTAFFGYGVSINDEYAVVGAYYGYLPGMPESGLAYVYKREEANWVIYDTLIPSNGEDDDRFGGSVCIDQDRIVVGCFDNREAYVYHLQEGDWIEEDTLYAGGYKFGDDVAICGDTAIVGYYLYNGNENDSGGIWVYVRNGSEWEQVNILLPGEAVEDAYLGKSLALTPDYLFSGAYGRNGDSVLCGQAYLYTDYITPNSISEETNTVTGSFALKQNYPNPFNPTTVISYQLTVNSNIELSIYNSLGQKITTLVKGMNTAGEHQVEWNAAQFSSGIYFYELKAGSFSIVKKMVLVK